MASRNDLLDIVKTQNEIMKQLQMTIAVLTTKLEEKEKDKDIEKGKGIYETYNMEET